MTAGEIAQLVYDYASAHGSVELVIALAGSIIAALLVLRAGRRRR